MMDDRILSRLTMIKGVYNLWLASVANVISRRISGLSSAHVIRFVESETGELLLHGNVQSADAPLQNKQLIIVDDRLENTGSPSSPISLSGCDVELVLRSERFLWQPLDLPARAAEFLDGIVQSQIDRLTPWTSDQAAYGWNTPIPQESDRISITIAAASMDSMIPYAQAFAGYGARSTSIYTETCDDETPTLIKVLDKRTSTRLDAVGIRHTLNVVLLVMATAAIVSIGASMLVGGYMNARQEELASKIAAFRGKFSGDASSSTNCSAHVGTTQI